MKKYRWVAVLALFALLVTSVGSVIGSTPVIQNIGVSTPPPRDPSITVNNTGMDARRLELKRVLGLSEKELLAMDTLQVQKLIEQNADKLGVQVYTATTDKDGKPIFSKIAGDKVFTPPNYGTTVKPTPEPPLPGYPAPGQGQTKPQSFAPQSVTTIYNKFVPIINVRNGLFDVQERYALVQNFVDQLYTTYPNQPYGYEHEYFGCPLALRNWQTGEIRQAGLYKDSNKAHVFGKVTWFAVGGTYDFQDYTFEFGDNWNYGEPNYQCDVVQFTDAPAKTQYQLKKISWTGNDPNNSNWTFMIDDTQISSNIHDESTTTLNLINKWFDSASRAYPVARYTDRQSSGMAALMYSLRLGQTEADRADSLWNTIIHDGLANETEIYTPMFELGTNFADDFMFTNNAYLDCSYVRNGIDSYVTYGVWPYRYGYESKVCIDRAAYITLSRVDYLAPALQALHILNKYNNPDYVYPNPDTTKPPTTPRQMARQLETNGWNGIGIRAFNKDPNYASGVRTFAFMALETVLGFKHGDAIAQEYADQAYLAMTQIQWGMPPFGWASGITYDGGYMTRMAYSGAFFLAWGITEQGTYVYGLPPAEFTADLIDMFAMPGESQMLTPSNSETSLSAWAALRLYLKYKYNQNV